MERLYKYRRSRRSDIHIRLIVSCFISPSRINFDHLVKMADFSEQQLEDIKEAFELFGDGENNIIYNKVGDVVRAMGECPTNEDIVKLLGGPTKEDMAAKKMTLKEFMVFFDKVIKEAVKGTYEDFMEGLRVFDKDGNGTVMGAEIRHVLTTLGEKLTAAEVSAMMQGQEDSSGAINYDAFSKFLLEQPKAAI